MTDVGMMLERTETVVCGVPLTLYEAGSGVPVLVLHDEWGLGGLGPLWEGLDNGHRVVTPVHPGFEDSPASKQLRSAGDLALLYLALLERYAEPAVVVGLSFGGWVALEMAVRCRHRIRALVLLGSTGLRFGSPTERNFADLFAHSDEELDALLYHDAAKVRRPDSADEEALTRWVRNREGLAHFGWEPYLHTPGLDGWTPHLDLPTLLVHGAEDRFVAPGYYERVAASVGAAIRQEIPDCGHFPHIEDPETTVQLIRDFVDGRGAR